MPDGPIPVLGPLPYAMAVFPNFIAQQSTSFKLKEKMFSFSGDSYHVETYPDQRPFLQVKGQVMSISDRTHVLDMNGQEMFVVRKKVFSIPTTYWAEYPNGQKFLDIEGKWSFGKHKAVGVFNYQDQQTGQTKQGRLNLTGGLIDRHADIVDEATGLEVARIDRQLWNMRQLLGDRDSYIVTVAPGMDMALIVAMAIAMDERLNEGKRR